MKILFVLENLSARCAANVNIALTLSKQLCSMDTQVFALTQCDGLNSVYDEWSKCFTSVYSFETKGKKYRMEFTEGKWKSCKKTYQKLLCLLRNPRAFLYLLDAKYFNYNMFYRIYRKKLEELCKTHDFDVVIGVSSPFYIEKAVANAHIKPKKAHIQLDPFTDNYNMSPRTKRMRAHSESRICKKLEYIFATDFVIKGLSENHICPSEKLCTIELPGLVVDNITESNNNQNSAETNEIRFLFTGRFYENIRRPDFLLQLFEQLPENYTLHLVGGGCEKLIEPYKDALGNRLICHGWLDKQTSDMFMRNADVLVNINNSVTNQLPSKIFEYICTQKAILNICKIPDCLSLPYANKYKKCLTIFEDDKISDETIKRLMSFTENRNNIIIDKEEIIKLYEKNTDVYVASLIRDKLSMSIK